MILPLGPLFDSELSYDEAMELYRARRAAGTADEAMFMGMRGVVLHLETANDGAAKTRASLLAHLDNHPTNERIADHLKEAHETTIRQRFVRRLGGAGAALVVSIGGLLGAAVVAIQFAELVRNW